MYGMHVCLKTFVHMIFYTLFLTRSFRLYVLYPILHGMYVCMCVCMYVYRGGNGLQVSPSVVFEHATRLNTWKNSRNPAGYCKVQYIVYVCIHRYTLLFLTLYFYLGVFVLYVCMYNQKISYKLQLYVCRYKCMDVSFNIKQLHSAILSSHLAVTSLYL